MFGYGEYHWHNDASRMQVWHGHVIEFESAREQPVHEGSLRHRQTIQNADRGCLLCPAFSEKIIPE
jgi:hypothetical protein